MVRRRASTVRARFQMLMYPRDERGSLLWDEVAAVHRSVGWNPVPKWHRNSEQVLGSMCTIVARRICKATVRLKPGGESILDSDVRESMKP